MQATSADSSTAARLAHLQRVYSLVVFLGWLANSLTAAVSVLFAQSRGLSLAQIGLYGAVYSLTAALLELPTGNLADVVGRRRVALLGFGLAAAARLALLFAFSLPVFLVYAVLWGAARALGSGALDAWFVNRVRALDPAAPLQPHLARVNTAELLALGIGPLLGSGLAAGLARTALPASGLLAPLSLTVAASVPLYLVTLLVARRVVHEAQAVRTPLWAALKTGLGSLPTALRAAARTVRRDALLPRLLLLEALTGLVLAASETYWQPFFAGRFGLGGSGAMVFGVLLAGCFLAGMLGNLCAERLLRRLGGRVSRLGALTQLVQALAFVALAWQGLVWLAAGLLWLSYFARTAFSSSFLGLYNGQLPDGQRSLMLSVLSMTLFVGFSLGNLALGAVSSRWSISWAWTLTAALLGLSVAVFPGLRPPPGGRSETPGT